MAGGSPVARSRECEVLMGIDMVVRERVLSFFVSWELGVVDGDCWRRRRNGTFDMMS